MNNLPKITKQVTIGSDTFNVIYSDCSTIKKETPAKLNLWDYIIIPFYTIKFKLIDIKHEIKYICQRAFRGYDDVDWYDLSFEFIDKYRKILTKYKNSHTSVPTEFLENPHMWSTTIELMLYYLDLMDVTYVEKLLCKDVPEHMYPNMSVIREINAKYKDKFFELFSKYFYELWD